MTNAQQITISAYVDAPPARAWDAYHSPQANTKWNKASPDWHCPSAKVDLRVGGKYTARMEARDGSEGFDFVATYEEVDAPRVVAFRLDDNRHVRTTFEPEGAGTRVTTVFEAETTYPVEVQREGWQAILDSYADYVRQTPAP
jgi:uncharacterized protein YndB with AHSA1/START domain